MTLAALDLTVLITVFPQAGCTAHGKAPADDVNRAASDRNDLGAAPMCSNVHTIAKSGHKTIEMVDNTVVKIVPKDGKRFSSNVHAYREGNDLVLCYADGTAVTISNL
jgi:hypothetical protein